MIITAIVSSSGSDRPACVETIHIAKNTAAANHAADVRRRKKIPIDQCGERASHMIDGRPTCIRHAGTAALNHIIENSALAPAAIASGREGEGADTSRNCQCPQEPSCLTDLANCPIHGDSA